MNGFRLIILAMAVVLCGCSSSPSKEADLRLDEAARLLQASKVKTASARIDAAIDTDPALSQIYLRAMRLLAAHKRYAEAARVGERMIRRAEAGQLSDKLSSDEMAGLYLTVGQVYHEAGNMPLAEERCRSALKLAPNSALALNALGWLYADSGTRLDQAVKLTRRAVALAPDEAAIVDSLGWALLKSGQTEEAITHLKRAVELDPNHPELRYHLGAAYEKAGRESEARIELNKALILDEQLTEAADLLSDIRKQAQRGRKKS